MQMYTLESVFGVSRDVPSTYTERDEVDGVFQNALRSKKHVVIRGDSKQGKTCLRKFHIPSPTCVEIQCQQEWEISNIYSNILNQIGFTIDEHEGQRGKDGRITAKFSAGALGLTMGIEGENKDVSTQKVKSISLPVNLNDAHDVVRAIRNIDSNKIFIVLDDFHYLPIITQSKFANEMRHFMSCRAYLS